MSLIYGGIFGFKKPWSELPAHILSQCSYKDIGQIGTGLAASCIIAFFVGLGGTLLLNRELPKFSKIQKSRFMLIGALVLIFVIEALKISQEGGRKAYHQ
jgi:hypothetical protein